jgi:hypothetical protein
VVTASAFILAFPVPRAWQMLRLILSTIAFFVATYFFRRYLDGMDIPKTMTRGIVVFVLALAVAYGIAFLVELF